MAVNAEAHLLFGLLALQNGFIDQAQLVAAFQAWTRQRSLPLADVLTTRGDLDPADRAAIEALVARHLARHGGDPEKSLAALDVARSVHHSLAALGDAEIDATLASLGDARAPDPTDVD